MLDRLSVMPYSLRVVKGADPMSIDLTGITYIQVTGERVTFNKEGNQWIATGWEKGLPVNRLPMTEQGVINTLGNYKEKIIMM
jgi:hypothetical protein